MERCLDIRRDQFSICIVQGIVLYLTVERSKSYLVTEVSGFLLCKFCILFLVEQYFSLIDI